MYTLGARGQGCQVRGRAWPPRLPQEPPTCSDATPFMLASRCAALVLLGLALSLLATIYPSWRAARTDPVEALRHE